MKKILLFLLLLGACGLILKAQNGELTSYANAIDKKDIGTYINVLASKEFEGRESGKRGGRMTAQYIREKFRQIGLVPPVDSLGVATYLQQVPMPHGTTTNVLGLVKGDKMDSEVIVITAHYDHLGIKKGKLYPGADDNAAGIAALLEIAQAFVSAKQNGNAPDRSILFMALGGEEKGLLGSKYYTDVDPIFPLSNTIVNLNMDMIGHLDDLHPDDPDFVSIVGSDWQSTDLHTIHEAANSKYVGMELDYTYNPPTHPEMFFYRSDQYNFAKHNIPVIFYTSGDHVDYHKPSDTVDKIELDRVQKVAKLVFYTAWKIANRKERIKVDKKIRLLDY